MVWRINVGERRAWVYLMLEFQSESDPWTALRMMVYVGLLAQHLVKEGELQDDLLPQIIPIVLYNGVPAWRGATNVADCFAPSLPGLQAYRPSQLYHLIDEARLKLHPLAEVRNLAEALFRLERSRTPTDMREVLQALDNLLKEPQMRPMRRRAPAANMTEMDKINGILEAHTMLEETIGNWFEEATRKGLSQGLSQGLQQGVQQGLQQGRQEGQQQGLVKAVSLQLQLRFGPVPEWAQSRLNAADEA